MSMITANNGQRSEDAQREEGWQEGSKGLYLQQSPCATTGSYCREEGGASLIIHIENTGSPKIFVIHNIKTTEEVKTEIFLRYPHLQNEKLELRCYSNQLGMTGRRYLEGSLPVLQDLWVTVYLRKH